MQWPHLDNYVGLDVGGTTMKAAVVTGAGVPLSKPVVMDTNPERGQERRP